MPGSYGGLPILSLSPNESDEDHVTSAARHGKKKGKSKLSNAVSNTSLRSNHGSARSSPILTTFPSRRRLRDESGSSTTLHEELGGQEASQFEARFNASALDPSIAGVSPVLESTKSSASSTNIDIDGDEDDDMSDGEELHDQKGNPSDNSPYAQVRASVAATDNTTLSIDTPRMWFLSSIFAIAGSSTNLFFSLRYPSVSLTPIIALLLVHPLGLFWDQVLKRPNDPEETFVDGCRVSLALPPNTPWTRRFRLYLAKGRWNEKEHCCVYVSSNVSFGFAFATDVSVTNVTFRHCANLITGYCRASKVLPSRFGHHVPDIAYSVHTNPRLLPCWAHTAIPSKTEWHDMAEYLGFHSYVYCIA